MVKSVSMLQENVTQGVVWSCLKGNAVWWEHNCINATTHITKIRSATLAFKTQQSTHVRDILDVL